MRNPFRGHRRWMNSSSHCELCGLKVSDPSMLDAHHITPQEKIREMKEELKITNSFRLKDEIKRARRNVASVCPTCHRKLTIGEIEIIRYVQSTGGKMLEWKLADSEELHYGASFPLTN